MKALNDEGFLRLEDFDKVVSENRSLLEEMLANDLKEPSFWAPPLTESAATWEEFISSMSRSWRNDLFQQPERNDQSTTGEREMLRAHSSHMYLHVLQNYGAHSAHIAERVRISSQDRRRREYKEFLRTQLAEYLSYVNANLVLSQTYETGFHDWYDFRPFYRAKFRRIGREGTPAEPEIDNVKRLFEISFPNLSFWEPRLIVKALKDKRIQDLRNLVARAVNGEVEFDTKFATRILYEVFRVERDLSKLRSIVSYATSPLGFLPWIGTPAQKGVEEGIVAPVARKQRKPFRWFYMISELAEKYRRAEIE
ncbi:MAG TPA: hypothetical protein VLL54_14160 [Pyrinomonadaceae bacterium]|nr:hypothetical protein [Pyrinomonadaceae bacterium]